MNSCLRKTLIVSFVCLVVLILSVGLSISFGSVDLNIGDIYKVIINRTFGSEIFPSLWAKSLENIVWDIRFPRVIMACVVGAGLALSGLLMQCITKNILADPYTLGISSGASTGAVAVLSLAFLPFSIPMGAFLGATISAVLVFVFASKRNILSTTHLVLTGVAISALFNALTNYIIFTTHDSRTAQTALFWMTGSLAGANWKQLPVCVIVLLLSVVLVYFIKSKLDIMLLGEDSAVTMGVNVKLLKIISICIITLLTGTMVAYSGPVGFIGLIIPHIVRGLLGTSIHKHIIPVSLLLGSIALLWSDVLAQTLAPPEEIPLGIITAFIGAPFFIVMLRKGSYSFGGK